MLELAEDRRRFGSPRLYELLRREGLVQNHKSLSGVRVVRVLEKLRLQGRLPQRIKVDNVQNLAVRPWMHGPLNTACR